MSDEQTLVVHEQVPESIAQTRVGFVNQIYTMQDLLRIALRAGIRCEEVVIEDGVLSSEDPGVPQDDPERIQTENLAQENKVAFGFKRHEILDKGRGICWIPIGKEMLDDVGLLLVFKNIAIMVNQRLDDLYTTAEMSEIEAAAPSIEITPNQSQEEKMDGEQQTPGEEQGVQTDKQDQPAESTRTEGGVQDGGGTGSNDGLSEDHPDHEANQTDAGSTE